MKGKRVGGEGWGVGKYLCREMNKGGVDESAFKMRFGLRAGGGGFLWNFGGEGRKGLL